MRTKRSSPRATIFSRCNRRCTTHPSLSSTKKCGVWNSHHATKVPYWKIAFYSGWSYTWGSILFAIDGEWAWMPLQCPSSEFKREAKSEVTLLFFFGALLYQLGAVTSYLEAINNGSFGGLTLKRFIHGKDEEM